MSFCLLVGMCTKYVSGAYRGQKRALDPLVLQLQPLASHHVSSGSLSQVLSKSSQCS